MDYIELLIGLIVVIGVPVLGLYMKQKSKNLNDNDEKKDN